MLTPYFILQAEVVRMKEVLEEISNAMRLAGIQFQTPKETRKTKKQPKINQGFDNSKDGFEDKSATPRSSSASGSHKMADSTPMSHKKTNSVSGSNMADSTSESHKMDDFNLGSEEIEAVTTSKSDRSTQV